MTAFTKRSTKGSPLTNAEIDANWDLAANKSEVSAFASGITLGAGTDVLSVYDEGTWTPTLSGITITGTNASYYYYTRIGRMVTLNIRLQAATSVAITNGATITLPSVGTYFFAGSGVLVNPSNSAQSAPCANNSTVIYVRGAFTTGANEAANLTLSYLVS